MKLRHLHLERIWPLGIALGLIIFFTPHPEWYLDLFLFRNLEEQRHPYWARWIFNLLEIPPAPVAFVILSIVCVGCFYLATRVFKGKPWIVFTSFAFAWTLFYGQIDGLVVGGLTLAWWAIHNDRPTLAGAGIILASIKPQLSIPLILAILYWSPSRIKSLIVPITVVGLTFIWWGWWLPQWVSDVANSPDLLSYSRNLSFWPLAGPWVLLVWPVTLFLPLPREKKWLAIATTTAMTVPYFPLPSVVLLLVLPIPVWFWLLMQMPFIFTLTGNYEIYHLMRVVPVALFIWIAWPVFQSMRHSRELQNEATR